MTSGTLKLSGRLALVSADGEEYSPVRAAMLKRLSSANTAITKTQPKRGRGARAPAQVFMF